LFGGLFDGNGRTARLLLSHLVRSHTVVPLSLFAQTPDHKDPDGTEYIAALRAPGSYAVPWAVLDFVLNCAVRTCRIAAWQQE